MASQKPSPNGAKSRSLSVPQDTKSNPSNGLVERLRASARAQARDDGYPLEQHAAWEAADENEKLREALEPFARIADQYDGNADEGRVGDDFPGSEVLYGRRRPNLGDFRRASLALYQQEGVLSSQRGDWVLVPRDPTDAMLFAAREAAAAEASEAFYTPGYICEPDAAIAYRAMLNASPTPPASQRGENRSANASLRPTLHGADTEAVDPGPFWTEDTLATLLMGWIDILQAGRGLAAIDVARSILAGQHLPDGQPIMGALSASPATPIGGLSDQGNSSSNAKDEPPIGLAHKAEGSS